MGRARRARKIAATAAYGGGGLAAGIGAVGMLGYGLLKAEARVARRLVGQPFEGAPDDNGTYGAGAGDPVELLVLGDSSAAGMGADHRYQTVGAIIANGVSALTGRPVRLTNTAVIGAESSGLELQLANALDQVPRPHVAVIMIGANDVTHRIDKSVAVRHLEDTVRRLHELGTEVVVGTCPDLGTIQPIPQPLRLLGRRWSRDLAAAQTVAVVEAGGRTVSLGDLLGPEFAERPHEMFSADRFHPSPAGYARAAAALLPSVYAALGVWAGAPTDERVPDTRRGEGVGPVAVAAEYAVRDPGTEVSATEIAGQSRGPRGRWAVLMRRPHKAVPDRQDERVEADEIDATDLVTVDDAVASYGIEGDGVGESESNATPPDPAARHTIDTD
ncbi:SGNH/GDSL hydrolase family protein [Nostocoides sp. HKS02]|uniref:SGNH/GDSL hydrolase family protein n=1 Tax=Nostocoides sp. HKS02 TaxID=1813880 RepID=UPI0012B4C652|nr:SGNH/GDSL hydrolase family protein [Tetrasphaera sp. HKS02]QGN59169.1 SGNH/GDSL hydrolase family protein [Tetrasphaera sp. HKS02]